MTSPMTTGIMHILGDGIFHKLWFKTPSNSALGRDSANLYMFIFWVSALSFCGEASPAPRQSLFWEVWTPVGFDQLFAASQASRQGAFSRRWLEDVAGRIERVLARGLPGGERVAYTQHFDPSLPPVQADGEKLTQVLLNLVRNAIEAAREAPDPEVTFETAVAPLRLRAASGRTRPLARVSVLDNGPGIPEAMLPRLFTPFATTKPQGTGLGLAVSRRIVEAHGGRIEVRNRAGRGAEASVFLPLSEA